MTGHDINALADGERNVAKVLGNLSVAFNCHQRIMGRWHNTLAKTHLNPAFLTEQFLVLPENAAARAKQVDLTLQCVGHRHIATMTPELAVVAFGRLVVKDDEIADPLIFEVGLPVIFGADRAVEVTIERTEPNGAVRPLAVMRRVYCYVPIP